MLKFLRFNRINMMTKKTLILCFSVFALSVISLFYLDAEKNAIFLDDISYEEVLIDDELGDADHTEETFEIHFVRVIVDFFEFIQEF